MLALGASIHAFASSAGEAESPHGDTEGTEDQGDEGRAPHLRALRGESCEAWYALKRRKAWMLATSASMTFFKDE
jgi:hypothetical protein